MLWNEANEQTTLSKKRKIQTEHTQTAKRKRVEVKNPTSMPTAPRMGKGGAGSFEDSMQMDASTARKFKRGLMPIDGVLDLHGKTQEEAYERLKTFIATSVRSHRRMLVIVTGKGRETVGVLKQRVPEWLKEEELRGHILATSPAQQKDGGTGALYVLLRRQRNV